MGIRLGQWARKNCEFVLFMTVGVFLGINSGLYESTFNNYLNDTFHLGAVARGALEFPREFPGMMVALISGLLFFLPDTRMGALSLAVMGVGALGLGLFSPGVGMMILWMVLYSAGTHLYMPLSTSIGVALSEEGAVGKRLGQLQGMNTAAMVVGSFVVWLGFSHLNIGYPVIFTGAAICSVAAAAVLLKIRPRTRPRSGVRFVLKRRYTLFYVLNVLFGARKQVFLTFGPWVLIKVFQQTPAAFAALAMFGQVAGVGVKPLIGRMVDRFGERAVIMFESVMLVFICLGYGFAERLHLGGRALYLVFACYVLDQLIYAVNMARATYLHKVCETPDDLTPTLSMGISIDHVVSMIVPIIGGVIWRTIGYEYVFLMAAGIAVINFVASRYIGRESFRRADTCLPTISG